MTGNATEVIELVENVSNYVKAQAHVHHISVELLYTLVSDKCQKELALLAEPISYTHAP